MRANVLQNLAFGLVSTRAVKSSSSRTCGIQRQRPRQHDALLLAARKARSALGNDRVELLRQRCDEVLQFGGRDGFFEIPSLTVVLKAMFSRSVRLKMMLS